MSLTGLYGEVHEGISRLFAAGVDDPLGSFGFADLLSGDDVDARIAVFAVAEAQGRAGATSSIVSRIALAGLQLPPAIGYGMSVGSPLAGAQGRLAMLGEASDELVLMGTGGSARTVSRAALTLLPSSLDPAYLTVYSYESSTHEATAPDMYDVQARARIACAAEVLGACEAMLADAIEYAKTRRQFGAPLVTFQAVSHTLAWAATELHQLRATFEVALTKTVLEAPDRVLAAAVKAMAGTVGKRVAQLTLQVTGGMGFTWEYSHNALHRRVLALDAVLGTCDALHLELGRSLRQRSGESDAFSSISLARLA